MNDWKNLQRHEISARYSDWPKELREAVCERIKADRGLFEGSMIWIYEGKILDGYQRHWCCAYLNIEPTFKEFIGSRIEAERFVESLNDHRRHMTAAELKELAEERKILAENRRKRVAEKLREGKSERIIAAEENVSQKTIHKDKEAITDTGVSVTPTDGKVTGKDNRKQPANKPVAAKILCGRCDRIGRETPPGCKDCKAARADARNGREREPGSDEPRDLSPKNGKVKYDWKQFESAIGVLMREVDRLGHAYGQQNTERADKLQSKLHQWRDEFRGWFEAISHTKAPK